MVREVRGQRLEQALLGLTAALGSRLIVEGVERSEELALLRRLGVIYCQGYLIGEPVNRLDMTSRARHRARSVDSQTWSRLADSEVQAVAIDGYWPSQRLLLSVNACRHAPCWQCCLYPRRARYR